MRKLTLQDLVDEFIDLDDQLMFWDIWTGESTQKLDKLWTRYERTGRKTHLLSWKRYRNRMNDVQARIAFMRGIEEG